MASQALQLAAVDADCVVTLCEPGVAALAGMQGPLRVVAVTGPAGDGNALTATLTGTPFAPVFPAHDTVTKGTSGIWISPAALRIAPGGAPSDGGLVLLDVEGLDMGRPIAEARLSLLATAVASTLVYNVRGPRIKASALDGLRLQNVARRQAAGVRVLMHDAQASEAAEAAEAAAGGAGQEQPRAGSGAAASGAAVVGAVSGAINEDDVHVVLRDSTEDAVALVRQGVPAAAADGHDAREALVAVAAGNLHWLPVPSSPDVAAFGAAENAPFMDAVAALAARVAPRIKMMNGAPADGAALVAALRGVIPAVNALAMDPRELFHDQAEMEAELDAMMQAADDEDEEERWASP